MAFLRAFFIFLFFLSAFTPVSAKASLSDFLSPLFKVFQSNTIEETASPDAPPAPKQDSSVLSPALPAFAEHPPLSPADQASENGPSLSITQNSALVSPSNPQGILSDDVKDLITTYIVKDGDSLSSIASNFGVTMNTILWTNDIKDARLIKPGDTLIILPISGVTYTVKKGDTLDSIAKKLKSSPDDIAQFNGLAVDEVLVAGTQIIIPDGEFQGAPAALTPSQYGTNQTPSTVPSRFAHLPDYPGYYLRPISGGRNSRATPSNPHGIHGFNGVDLANGCGLPISASAEGAVIIAKLLGWNGGYGKYVVISHPNGTQTLYGHMSAIFVQPGQQVDQGYEIGLIGRTGNSTGCHVHFEIRGARNPF